jgi:predicted acyltransferase
MHSPGIEHPSKRLLSLDVMRGLIMILLAAESCQVYESLNDFQLSGTASVFVQQFFHHPWHGLRFWDLVQPAFMTMAGTALFLSYYHKTKKGISWERNFKHIALRCLKLFICGTALHCIYAGKVVWELWNVLTQLSVTTLIAYLVIRQSSVFQIVVSVLLLVLTEVLYRFVLIPGYDQPFVIGKNFGSWVDMLLMGKINRGGWVAFNCIPTAAHTIWGVLAGKLLISDRSPFTRIRFLLVGGTICLAAGYALDLQGITPVIKRICTSSFVLVSGGWVLLMLALLYWLTDIKKWNKYAWIFTVVGMNAIFIYLFFETVGQQWLNGAVGIFVKGFFSFLVTNEKWIAVFSALTVLFAEWYLCYWLFKKKIFFKL